LPTDAEFRVRLDASKRQLRKTVTWYTALCIVGIFGTTNTGAVDPVRELRTIGGSGGDVAFTPMLPMAAACALPCVADAEPGFGARDSITIDPHKWFYAPLVREQSWFKDDRRLTGPLE